MMMNQVAIVKMKALIVVNQLVMTMKKKDEKRKEKENTKKKLVHEAKQLLQDIKYDERKQKKKVGKKRKTLKGGATGAATRGISNNPPKMDNPLKRELNNLQGLEFANQAGSLITQPSSIELLPPKDMSKEATKPEQTTSGVELETTRTL